MISIHSILILFCSPDDDFVQLTTNLTFMSAEQTQTDFILFRIIDDDLEEPVEEFLISVGPVTATITIIDDDDGGEYYTHHLFLSTTVLQI